MKSKVLVVMALILAVATAATAATAFAEPKKKRAVIAEQVTNSVHLTSQAILRLKVRALRTSTPPQTIPVTARVKPN